MVRYLNFWTATVNMFSSHISIYLIALATKSIVCDHLDSDTNQLTFSQFWYEEICSKWYIPYLFSYCQHYNFFCDQHTVVSLVFDAKEFEDM